MIFKLILIFIVTIVAFWLSAICGGGASLILIPILNIFVPISVVPFSLTVGTFTSSSSRIVVFRKHINWKIFFWFVPFSIPAVISGAYLIKFTNPLYLQLMVSLFLIANLPELFKSKSKLRNNEKPYPEYVLAIVGVFAGFLSGITGAVGLVFNRFYLKYGLSKEEIVATRAANEICLHFIKLSIYIALGLYSKAAFFLGLTIAIAAVISAISVKYILPYLSEFIFRKIGYGAMALSGVLLLSNASIKMIRQDNLHFSTKQLVDKKETAIHWRESYFVLEYAVEDGELEVEIPVDYNELPDNLKLQYNELIVNYDKILLEKVFQFGKPAEYEFYCYKNNALTKIEFEH